MPKVYSGFTNTEQGAKEFLAGRVPILFCKNVQLNVHYFMDRTTDATVNNALTFLAREHGWRYADEYSSHKIWSDLYPTCEKAIAEAATYGFDTLTIERPDIPTYRAWYVRPNTMIRNIPRALNCAWYFLFDGRSSIATESVAKFQRVNRDYPTRDSLYEALKRCGVGVQIMPPHPYTPQRNMLFLPNGKRYNDLPECEMKDIMLFCHLVYMDSI